jgi:hypothetical protein
VWKAARHLRRRGTRALLISATGTGKTLMSIRIADALDARLVLFVVPTLDLAAQTALAWRADGHREHMVIVSSMDTSGHEVLAANAVGSTVDFRTLAGLMAMVGEKEDQIPALTVICTYDSLDKVENTPHSRFEVPPFDLAVMDEAHRIAGRADKKWAVVNDATRIRAPPSRGPVARDGVPSAGTKCDGAGGSVPAVKSGETSEPRPVAGPTTEPRDESSKRAGPDGRADLVHTVRDLSPGTAPALPAAHTQAGETENVAACTLPPDLAAVADARAWTSRQLAAWTLDDLAFTTTLIVSELVTNALRYAPGRSDSA